MILDYKARLLYTLIESNYKGQHRKIDNVVIDIGVAEAIINLDIVEAIGMFAELGDKIISYYGVGGSIHNVYEKSVDLIKFGKSKIKIYILET